jgi:lysine 6-dehydrogenase
VKVLVLGSGLIGPAIASDLLANQAVKQVVVADRDSDRLKACASKISDKRLSTQVIDVSDVSAASKLMTGFSVVVCALPHSMTIFADTAAIRAGVSLVDLAFEDDQMALDSDARKAGITLIPGCGVAPGLTNILAAHAAETLDVVEEIHIKCGGIPQKPQPPLWYKVVFSLESVLNMYTRRVRIVRNGKVVEVDSLSDLEPVDFPAPFGRLDCFNTDGLATLLHTMKNVRTMDEKTIRWPGHIQKIKTMIECGLLGTTPVKVGNVQVSPREVLARLLSPILALGDDKDVTLLRVEVLGQKGNSRIHCTYDMIDYYDEAKQATSMARTTAYPASIAAQMVAQGQIEEKGLVPPERAFRGPAYSRLITELAKRSICFKEIIKTEQNVK